MSNTGLKSSGSPSGTFAPDATNSKIFVAPFLKMDGQDGRNSF
jgi:hypothetical protein